MMLKSDFYYDLPGALIAQSPPDERGASRLLHLDANGQLWDRQFQNLSDLLRPGDLLVLNDTEVMPARLFGHKATGGQVEILIERVLESSRALAHLRASKSPKPGAVILMDGGFRCRVIERRDGFFLLDFMDEKSVHEVLTSIGHIPLPPYINRADNNADRDRYQTVFARTPGAVAAPTAGLHFDKPMLARLSDQGIGHAFVTLHVGSGTFLPVRVDDLDQHTMHGEYCCVPEATVVRVNETHARGARVVAVGTTVVRSLETAARSGRLEVFQGETQLFIRPGFEFKCVDAVLTNFHLPESTLLTLVCAFAGYDAVMNAYHHAVSQAYRFFSYGDAMFLDRPQHLAQPHAQESAFQIHPWLQEGCIHLGRMDLCHILLMNDRRFPWLILVPERTDITEIHELSDLDQLQLIRESSAVAAHMKQLFNADKMNVAAIGNLVPQLHVHHVVRYRDDSAWPAPVWGRSTPVAYDVAELESLLVRLELGQVPGFIATGTA